MPQTIRPADAPRSTLSHADILRVMFGIVICILLAALDQTAVIPAVPAMARDLGTHSQLSWIVAAYLITSTISTPIYSKLSDLYGRRRLILICIAAFVATSLLCGIARSLGQLIWARGLQGLGGGGLMSLTQAAIADVVSPRERGRYQGYISATWALASLSGPIVGGFVAESLSWRWIFWINLPIGAAAMWACNKGLRGLASPLPLRSGEFDLLGMALLAATTSLLLLALGWGGNTYAWASPQVLGLTGLGFFLLLLLVAQERRAHDPVLPPRLFTSVSYTSNIIVSTLASLVMFMCVFAIPLYFQYARGATATESGAYVAPFMVAMAGGNVIASRYARRVGAARPGLLVGSALACSGLVLLAVLSPIAPVWAVVAAMALTGPGIGCCHISAMMGSQNALGARDIGTGTGALVLLRSVGGASGSTLAGAIIAAGLAASHADMGGSFEMVYAAAAAFVAVIFFVALRMPHTALRDSVHSDPLSE